MRRTDHNPAVRGLHGSFSRADASAETFGVDQKIGELAELIVIAARGKTLQRLRPRLLFLEHALSYLGLIG